MTDARSFTNPLATGSAGAGWGWILAYGVVSALLGLAAFAWPFAATLAATLVIGAFFIAAGIVSIGAGIFGKGHEGRGYAIGFGLLSLIVGLLMAFEPATGAFSLTLMVAIWLGVRGAMEIGLGARFRRGRGLMIALGVINILLAVYVLMTLPWSALTLPGFILGISFLFGGVTSIAAALNHRKGAPAFATPAV
ncbi:HdeD family acid-resistance protein [Sphingomonas sp. MA1305]|uniref:HdeD family acid-resistance protein n=1 Tax=Sphingomonas sp. MA1305 TaxID=2479204 RepID=UPI0018DFD93D|nr:HdeD family acid-resistance protein [Sphingomonas sp. MA1305]MBI0474784.1 HdeD family acid-resistance protein [Sphingomonas sp. MA1305]